MARRDKTKIIDKGWKQIKRELLAAEGKTVDVGVQAGTVAADGMDMAGLAAVHEFGAMVIKWARWQTNYRKMSKSGRISRKFVKKSKSNFAEDVFVGSHVIQIPARPFLRTSFDENKEIMNRFIQSVFRRVIARLITAEQALNLIGQKFTGIVQRKMIEGPWTPNAPSTVRQKLKTLRGKARKLGSAGVRPLINTGRMRQSIRHVVRNRS